MISLNKDGKVFLSTGDSKDDLSAKRDIIKSINDAKSLGLTDADIAALVKAPLLEWPSLNWGSRQNPDGPDDRRNIACRHTM